MHAHITQACMHAYTQARRYTRKYAHKHTDTHTYIHTYIHTHTYAFRLAGTNARVQNTHTRARVRTRAHTHTQSSSSSLPYLLEELLEHRTKVFRPSHLSKVSMAESIPLPFQVHAGYVRVSVTHRTLTRVTGYLIYVLELLYRYIHERNYGIGSSAFKLTF